jgi:hypothetical protein
MFASSCVELSHDGVVALLQLGGARLVGVGLDFVQRFAGLGDQAAALFLQLSRASWVYGSFGGRESGGPWAPPSRLFWPVKCRGGASRPPPCAAAMRRWAASLLRLPVLARLGEGARGQAGSVIGREGDGADFQQLAPGWCGWAGRWSRPTRPWVTRKPKTCRRCRRAPAARPGRGRRWCRAGHLDGQAVASSFRRRVPALLRPITRPLSWRPGTPRRRVAQGSAEGARQDHLRKKPPMSTSGC